MLLTGEKVSGGALEYEYFENGEYDDVLHRYLAG